MEKQLFVENMSTPLTYKEAEDHTNSLGSLEGVGGSWKEPTRNDHLYVKRLWENVLNSESFQEGMETHTIFAETNHPEDRIEIDLKEVAGVLTKLEILDNGDIFTAFDILPTPNGKIIKALIDYGCKIGVSSRGLGDEIIQNGVKMIDPETYEYYCHDFVVTPAVKKARPEVVESRELNRFSSTVSDIIKETEVPSELCSIRNLLENTQITNKNVLIESINKKISSLAESADSQSNAKSSKNELKEAQQKLKRAEKSSKAYKKRVEALQTQLKRRSESSANLRHALQEHRVAMEKLEQDFDTQKQRSNRQINVLKNRVRVAENRSKNYSDTIAELEESLQESQQIQQESARKCRINESKIAKTAKVYSDYERLQGKLEQLQSAYSELQSKYTASQTYAESLENKITMLESKYTRTSETAKLLKESANSSVKNLRYELDSMEENNSQLSNKLAQSEKQISELNKTKADLVSSNNALLDEYIRKSCEASNLSYEAVINKLRKPYTLESINRVINELDDQQRRFDMLPLVMPKVSGKIVEHNASHEPAESTHAPSFVIEALKRG